MVSVQGLVESSPSSINHALFFFGTLNLKLEAI